MIRSRVFLIIMIILSAVFLSSCASVPETERERGAALQAEDTDGGVEGEVEFLREGIQRAESLDEIAFSSIEFIPPEPQKHLLSNGMTVFLLEDHELPLFDLYAVVKTGSIYVSREKRGLESVFPVVMRTGGTPTREPDELNEELESLAASVEINMGAEYVTASLSCLAGDMGKGLEIFADIMKNPAFREEKLDLRKLQVLETIRRRNDNPVGIARRYFSAMVYGTEHPRGWYPTEDTVNAISREDLRSFHSKYFVPDNIMLAVTGSFETEALLEELESLFGSWQKVVVDFPEAKEITAPSQREVYYIPKDLNQTTIFIGHLGFKRSPGNEDYFPLLVMNEILGGSGFTSRLFREVRDKRGLAYAVGSALDTTSYEYPGVWFAYSLNRADKTCEAISLMLDIIEDIRRNPVGEEELSLIKEHIVNSFIFGFESSSQVVFQQLMLDFRGYPQDFLETYTEKIEAVTAEDVIRVAEEYLHPDKLVFVVVGNSDYFDGNLSDYGKVQEIVPD
ncbi:MAG: insulinase family protein [Spirochaetes bacterium]|nr:MAG: insulinase family protein [Spirochaetota bacterium]